MKLKTGDIVDISLPLWRITLGPTYGIIVNVISSNNTSTSYYKVLLSSSGRIITTQSLLIY